MDTIAIGKKLARLRGSRRREEVAYSVGISVSALQMYENGKRVPRDEIKEALSAYYGVDVSDIFFAKVLHET